MDNFEDYIYYTINFEVEITKNGIKIIKKKKIVPHLSHVLVRISVTSHQALARPFEGLWQCLVRGHPYSRQDMAQVGQTSFYFFTHFL